MEVVDYGAQSSSTPVISGTDFSLVLEFADFRDRTQPSRKTIVQCFGSFKDSDIGPHPHSYDRPKLVRLVYEYASGKSKDNVLRALFDAMKLLLNDDAAIDFSNDETAMLNGLVGFADHLIDNFFLPLKASTKKTPQPSPVYHSAIQSVRAGGQTFSETSARLSTLQGNCLTRDRH